MYGLAVPQPLQILIRFRKVRNYCTCACTVDYKPLLNTNHCIEKRRNLCVYCQSNRAHCSRFFQWPNSQYLVVLKKVILRMSQNDFCFKVKLTVEKFWNTIKTLLLWQT